MIIAITVLTVGFVAIVGATHRFDLRLGGVVVVPLLAVYTLRNVEALPLFVLSGVTAYVSILLVQRRVLLYGRQLLIAAIGAGALVPMLTVIIFDVTIRPAGGFGEVEYIASVLPGIAAYNLYRLDREKRRPDLAASLALLCGLLLLGGGLARLLTGTGVASATPPVVLVAGTELAKLTATQQFAQPSPNVVSDAFGVTLIIVGMVASEFARDRWGLRTAGVIALPLLAIFVLSELRLLLIYLVTAAVVATIATLVHRATFLYGRNLLAFACIAGTILVVPLATAFDLVVGIRALIVGLLAGVAAYHYHALPDPEVVPTVAMSAGIFTVLYASAWFAVGPAPSGLAAVVTPGHLAVGGLAVAAAAWSAIWLEAARPPSNEVLEANVITRNGRYR